MKLSTLSVKVFTSLAFVAKFTEGRDCVLPTYTGMLSAADPNVASLYCTLPTRELQEFTESVAESAFEMNALPPNNFLATCFPSIFSGLASRVAGMEASICTASETPSYPYVKVTNGFQTDFIPWEHEFCVNFDICNEQAMNRYLATMFLQAHMIFGSTQYEYGYYVLDHYLPSTQCAKSLRTISEPEAFCSGAFNCDFPSLVDVTIGSGRSFEVAICNDGCATGSSAGMSEGDTLRMLTDFARGSGYIGPFCAGPFTPVMVQRSSAPFDFSDYCQSSNARERTGNC